MKQVLRFFLILVFCYVSAHAQWRQTQEIRLKKDQVEQIMLNTEGLQKLLEFRWTLYANDRLVVFHLYDGIPTQHILRLNYHNQSIRTDLLEVMPTNFKMPFILIKFKSFDHEKNEAVFELMLRDEDEKYVLKFLNRDDVNE